MTGVGTGEPKYSEAKTVHASTTLAPGMTSRTRYVRHRTNWKASAGASRRMAVTSVRAQRATIVVRTRTRRRSSRIRQCTAQNPAMSRYTSATLRPEVAYSTNAFENVRTETVSSAAAASTARPVASSATAAAESRPSSSRSAAYGSRTSMLMPESSSTHAGSVNVCTRSSTFHRSPSPAAAFTAVRASTYAASATQAVRTNTVRKNAKKRSSAMRRSAPQSAPSPAAAGGAVLGDIGRLRNEVIVRSGVEPPDRPQPMPAPQRIASNDPNVREVFGERRILQPIALDSKCVEIARRHTAHQVTRVPLALRRQSREKGITEPEEVDHVHLGPDGKTENAVGSPLDD